MAYSIQTVLNDLSGVVHGTQMNKVPNPYGLLSRTARTILLDVDPKETQRIVPLASQVFNDVFDYPLPTDVKGDRIIDLRVQAGREPNDVYFQGYSEKFDANKIMGANNAVLVQWNSGVKTFRIEAPTLTAPITLTDTSTLTGWTATAGAQNISLNSTNYVAGGGAIQFDLAAGSSTGSIQTTTLNPINLSGHVNIDTEFYWVYLPLASAITNLNLKWGSDLSNYYTATVTTNQQGLALQNGWNLIAITWSAATKVGSPVVTAYDTVQLTVTYNSTLQTGLMFCNLTSNAGTIFNLVYYSKFLFRDPVTNAFQETVVDVTDNNKVLNLDTESYNLFFNKAAYYVAQTLQGADAGYDALFWGGSPNDDPKKAGGGEYGRALRAYIAQNPSEAMIKATSYYDVPKRNNAPSVPLFRP